jgi:tetratricopeptide (TPR) repeat protein
LKKILILTLTLLSLCTGIFAQTQKEIFDNGVLLFKKGQYQNAIDAFSKLIEIAPDHADAYKNRGVSYMKQQKFDLAIQDFEIAKALFPELKGLYSNLGVAWYYKKEYEKAIKSYDIELEMAPENYVAYFNRSLCLAELDKNDEALDDLEKTLNLKPDFYWAICYKADLLANKKGDYIKARQTYEKAIGYDSKNPYAKDKLSALNQTIEKKQKQDQKTKIENKTPESSKQELVQTKKTKETSKDINNQNSGFTIQVGAFLNQDNAFNMKTKLINMGFDSRVLLLTDSKEKTWYLVRSGKYADKERAQKDLSSLEEQLGIKTVIRPIDTW